MRKTRIALLVALASSAARPGFGEEDRAARVRRDLEEFPSGAIWHYTDLSAGLEEARRSGKPLLEKFVRVRILALRVKHAGEYGEHSTAKDAGVRKGDIVVEVDGSSAPLTETGFIARSVEEKRSGDRVELVILRGSERRRVSFALR